jgi:hypothetical protein
MHAVQKKINAALAMIMTAVCIGRAQTAAPSETQVKAAFLVNFPKYIEWPAEAFGDTNTSFVIATFGETSLDGELRKMVQGRTVNGRPVVLKRVTTNAECGDCHILFIPDSERRRVAAILENLKNSSVLTVSESDDFLDKGGTVNLVRRDRKVRLEFNLAATRQARLQVSSKLLNVADVVKGK